MMGFDNGSANRQAHPHALRLRRKERMEDAVQIFRVNSRPRILHGYQDALGIAYRRFQPQTSCPIVNGIHGLDRVGNKIGDDLPQLDPVRQNRSQFWT